MIEASHRSSRAKNQQRAIRFWPIFFLLLAWSGLVAMRPPIEEEKELEQLQSEWVSSGHSEDEDHLPSEGTSEGVSEAPSPASSSTRTQEPVVVIDPGHGGSDPGAVHYGTYEKHVVLEIAKRLETKLREQNIKTILTRSEDRYVSFEERIQIATKNHAVIFVSLHCNAALVRANGVEVYWSQTQSPLVQEKIREQFEIPSEIEVRDTRSRWLAERTLVELIDHTEARNRGAKPKAHIVTRRAPCPAILVECGFLSDRKERLLLTKKEGQEKISTALSSAIATYLKEIKMDPRFQIQSAKFQAPADETEAASQKD